MINPDSYYAQLFKQIDGEFIEITDTINFKIIPLNEGYLQNSNTESVVRFWEEVSDLRNKTNNLSFILF